MNWLSEKKGRSCAQAGGGNATEGSQCRNDQYLQEPSAEVKAADFAAKSEMEAKRKSIWILFAEGVRRIEKGSDMTARSALYRKIADAFKEANDDEMAITYYNKALAIEESLGKEDVAAVVYEDLANAYYNSGDFQNSLSTYEKCLSLKRKSGDKAGASKVLSEIANVYETTYDYKNAIEY
ncbi:MAG: tetratricopeptide repeat protein [Marinilabiliales bacterium]|nr:tetratricopeptide repeat protein [Marinilabiliales bacterium]